MECKQCNVSEQRATSNSDTSDTSVADTDCIRLRRRTVNKISALESALPRKTKTSCLHLPSHSGDGHAMPKHSHKCLCSKIMQKLNSISNTISEALVDHSKFSPPKPLPKKSNAVLLRKISDKYAAKKAKRSRSGRICKFCSEGLVPDSGKTAKPSDLSSIEDVKPTLEELNPKVKLSITNMNGNMDRFEVRKFDCLDGISDYYQQKTKPDCPKVVFTLDSKPISLASNSYGSLNINDKSVVQVEFVPEPVANLSFEELLIFKVQFSDDKNKYFHVYMRPREKMSAILQQVAEKVTKSPDKLNLFFNKKLIRSYNTATQLNLKGGECLTLRMAR